MDPSLIVNMIKESFDNFDSKVQKAIEIVTTAPDSNVAMNTYTNNIYNVVLPVAFSLAVLYFFMSFLNSAINLDFMRWEAVAKHIFRFCLCKGILQNVRPLMTSIFDLITSITSSVGVTTINMSVIDYNALQNSLKDVTFIDFIITWIKYQPISLFMFLITKIILLIVFGRMIQIYIYTMFAPIPLATLAGEGFNSAAKNFLKEYASVCFQGTVIIASIGLYKVIASTYMSTSGLDTYATMGELLLMSLVLILLLVKSGDWAKKIVGGN